jgi:triphosphatase
VAEALSPLFAPRAWRAYAERLKAAQEALGHFNDVCVAQAVVARLPATDAAGFALGWLAATKPAVAAEAGRALQRLRRAPKFLR